MRKIPLLLAAATLIPVATLSWLALHIFQQDRDLERQRRREGLEVSAGRLAIEIERRLRDIEERLAQGDGIRLESLKSEEAQSSVFSEAEAAEFQRQDLSESAVAYRRFAQSTNNPQIRAAALVRLARVERKAGEHHDALRAYSDLEKLGATPVGGQPAALLAKQGRCRILENTGESGQLHKEAVELAHALDSAQWPIDRITFDVYREMTQRWGVPPAVPDALARVESATELRGAWRSNGLPPRGRRILYTGAGPVLAMWNGATFSLAAQDDLRTLLRSLSSTQDLAISLYDTDGQLLFGSPHLEGVSLTPGETRLPFILRVASSSGGGSGSKVLISGLLLALALMIAAGYGLYRATTRELLLARRQSDFVAAVSHEFRTPLTSMRHLTELLASRGVTSEERKTQYYGLLARETERLHRMVESLLSFGRIEVGAYAWRLEPADAAQLVRQVVEEFRVEPQACDRPVSCEIEPGLPLSGPTARR
jgi:signal transduction histidine kinase